MTPEKKTQSICLPTELAAAVESVAQLFRETVELTDGLYQPRFTLPM
jgi:hypothetical protein